PLNREKDFAASTENHSARILEVFAIQLFDPNEPFQPLETEALEICRVLLPEPDDPRRVLTILVRGEVQMRASLVAAVHCSLNSQRRRAATGSREGGDESATRHFAK